MTATALSAPNARRATSRWVGLAARVLVALTAATGATTVGCGGKPVPRVPTPPPAIRATPVADDAFAKTTFDALKAHAATPERRALLYGVVERQLVHAGRRFASGHPDQAHKAALGAFGLLERGDAPLPPVSDPLAVQALAGAVERVSQRGDEGKALPLLRLLAASAQSPTERAAAQEHIVALERWASDLHHGGLLHLAGEKQRIALSRALFEPTEENVNVAEAAVYPWVDGALEVDRKFTEQNVQPERQEGIETMRALRSAPITLIGLHLRAGSAPRALAAIQRTSVREMTPPEMEEVVRRAAEEDDLRAWLGVVGMFAQYELRVIPSETTPPPELLAAGLWRASLEAFRRDPSSFEAGLWLSRLLVRRGLSEVAPLVLVQGLGERPSAPKLTAAMEVLFSALLEEVTVDDVDGARRTMAAAEPVLTAADRASIPVVPAPAQLRLMMAGAELRAGNLAAARTLALSAAGASPSPRPAVMLARIERQAGDRTAALRWVDKAVTAPDARREPLELAQTHVLAFELRTDAGDGPGAKRSLDDALALALGARGQRLPALDLSGAERVLGRVLDHYGEGRAAARAYARALQHAATDRDVLGETVVEAVSRALLRRDLPAARAALLAGLDGQLTGDDIVYAALWTWLLERELRAAPDGAVDRAFRAAVRGSWTAKLAAWAQGKLSDAALEKAALSPAQKVEAEFYLGMSRRLDQPQAANERLRGVSKSPILGLVEVELARELLAPARAKLPLPSGTKLP